MLWENHRNVISFTSLNANLIQTYRLTFHCCSYQHRGFFLALQPNPGLGCLIFFRFLYHTQLHTSQRPVSKRQQTNKRDEHPCTQRGLKPRSQQLSGSNTYALDCRSTNIGPNVYQVFLYFFHLLQCIYCHQECELLPSYPEVPTIYFCNKG